MADSIYTFDPVAANNTSLDTIPYGPNQLYHNQIDNLFRAYAAKLAQLVDDLGAVNTVAGTDTITCTLASGIAAYATGQFFQFIAAASNTGAATMNVNSIGAKAIRKISGGTDVALSAGDIAAGETYMVVYRATANAAAGGWVLVGLSAAIAFATNAQAVNGTSAVLSMAPATSSNVFGACQLTKVSTNLSLARYSGSKLFINGVFEVVPTTPVTLAPTSLAINTTYYIYAFMSAGTMTLEASATAPATDATYGHQIKTADATRTLVGMARTNGSTAWVDSATQRFVISYFNRREVGLDNAFTATQTTTSGSYVELSTSIRCEFLTWADEAIFGALNLVHSNSGARVVHTFALAFDGTTPESNFNVLVTTPANAGDNVTAALSGVKSGLAIGYHYATLLANTNSGTMSVNGAAGGTPRTSVALSIRG